MFAQKSCESPGYSQGQESMKVFKQDFGCDSVSRTEIFFEYQPEPLRRSKCCCAGESVRGALDIVPWRGMVFIIFIISSHIRPGFVKITAQGAA